MAAARNALGVVALNQGNLPSAEAQIRQALEMKPDVRLAHFNLALLAEKRKRPATAEAEYCERARAASEQLQGGVQPRKLYEEPRRPADQEAAFGRRSSCNPDFGEGYFYLAKLLLDQGRRVSTKRSTLARKGLEVAPKSAYAPLGHYVLADLYSRLGRPGRMRPLKRRRDERSRRK
jgi:tetratricopeptide (TPR) repeat protein